MLIYTGKPYFFASQFTLLGTSWSSSFIIFNKKYMISSCFLSRHNRYLYMCYTLWAILFIHVCIRFVVRQFSLFLSTLPSPDVRAYILHSNYFPRWMLITSFAGWENLYTNYFRRWMRGLPTNFSHHLFSYLSIDLLESPMIQLH